MIIALGIIMSVSVLQHLAAKMLNCYTNTVKLLVWVFYNCFGFISHLSSFILGFIYKDGTQHLDGAFAISLYLLHVLYDENKSFLLYSILLSLCSTSLFSLLSPLLLSFYQRCQLYPQWTHFFNAITNTASEEARTKSNWLMKVSIDLEAWQEEETSRWSIVPPGRRIRPCGLFDSPRELCINNVNSERLLTIANDISSVYRCIHQWLMITSAFGHWGERVKTGTICGAWG